LGILIDKELKQVKQVFIPIYNAEDAFLIDYAQKLIYNNAAKVVFFDINNFLSNNFVLKSAIDTLEESFPDNVALMHEKIMKKDFLANQDLIIISLESWKKLVDARSVWLSKTPSMLILKPN
jgi:hypothetical protein